MDFGLLWNAIRSAATNVGNFLGNRLPPTEEQKQKPSQPPPQKAPVSPQAPKPKTQIEPAPFVSTKALQLPEVQRLRSFLEQHSTTFKTASPQEKNRILVDVITAPQKFFDLASRDKGLRPILNSPPEDIQALQKTLEDLTQKVRTTTMRTSGMVREAYFDPITGLVGAGASAVISKLPFLRTLASWYAGEIAGETAKQTYEASTGKEAPFWVTMPVDIVAGTAAWKIGERAARRAGEKVAKEIGEKGSTRIVEETVKEADTPKQIDPEEARQWIATHRSDPREGFLSYPQLFPKTRAKIVEELLQPTQLQIDPKEAARWTARYERDPKLGFLLHPSFFPKTAEKARGLLQASQLKIDPDEAKWWGHLLRIDPEFVPLLFSKRGDLRDEFLQIAERIRKGPSQFALKTKGELPQTKRGIEEDLSQAIERARKEFLQREGKIEEELSQNIRKAKEGLPPIIEEITKKTEEESLRNRGKIIEWLLRTKGKAKDEPLQTIEYIKGEPSQFTPKATEELSRIMDEATEELSQSGGKTEVEFLQTMQNMIKKFLPTMERAREELLRTMGKTKDEALQAVGRTADEVLQTKEGPLQTTEELREELSRAIGGMVETFSRGGVKTREEALQAVEEIIGKLSRIKGKIDEKFLQAEREVAGRAYQDQGKRIDEILQARRGAREETFYIKGEPFQFTEKAQEELSQIIGGVIKEFSQNQGKTEAESLQFMRKTIKKFLPTMGRIEEELLRATGKTREEFLRTVEETKEGALQTTKGIEEEFLEATRKMVNIYLQDGVKTKEEALQVTEEIIGKLLRITRKIDEKLSQDKGLKRGKKSKGPEGPPSPPKGPPRGPEEPPPVRAPEGLDPTALPKGASGGTQKRVEGSEFRSFADPVSVSIHALGQAWRAISNAIKGSRSAEELLKDIDPAAYELVKQQRGGERLRNVFMKLLPRYDQLAKVPDGPQIFRAAETFTKGFERDLQVFFREDWADLFRGLEKLGDNDKNAVRQALEGEIPIEQLSPKLQEVVSKSRQWLDSIFEYARREGLIEAERYRKDYFPRVFDGNIVISSAKGYRVAGNWDEALKVASKWKDEGLKPKIRVYMSLDAPRAMEAFGMTTTRIDLEPQDVQKVLASFKEESPKVAEKLVGNLLERRYGLEGYVKDPVKALETYGYRVVKKVWQDKLVNEVKPYLDAIKDPVLENGVKSYLRQVLGHPTPTEEALAHTLSNITNSRIGKILTQILFGKQGARVNPGDVKRGIGFANLWLNHVSMLGWMISTSLMNLVQALHVVPAFASRETGIALREFIRYLKQDQGKLKELYEVGVISKPEVFASVSPEKLAQVFLKPMEKLDEIARVMTYETAKNAVNATAKEGEEAARQFMAKKLKAIGIQQNDPVMDKIWGERMDEAIKSFAVAFTDRAQFRYEVYASPEALSSSIMRLLFPYKSFLLNYLTLSSHYLTNGLIKRNDVKGALTFFAVPLLLGGVYVHPFIGMPFAMLDKMAEQVGYDLKEVVKEELGPMGIVLTRGLPALGDIDIRHSLEVIIPTAPQELFGPIPQAGMKMVGQINQGIDPTNWEDWKAVLGKGAETFTPRLVKAASEAKDMWETGLIRDKQGRVVGEATEKDAVLRLLGFQPEEKIRYYDARQDIAKLDKMVERRYEPKFDELANAIVEGDLNKAEKLKNEILQDIEKWHEKAKRSKGVERIKAEWVVRKLSAGLRGLEKRVQNRMVPYRSDKKSITLHRELMGDDAYKMPMPKKWRQEEVDIEEEEEYY